MDYEIKFVANENRSIALIKNKIIGECDFDVDGDTWLITHTFVDEKYGGRGIAKKLVLAIVDEAEKKNKKIIPLWSYAKKVLGKE